MKKVLVIDDEIEMHAVFDNVFKEQLGFEFTTFAADGFDGFVECSLQKFDIITLDHVMPLMDGAQFLVALRSKPGLNQDTPVIMVSGHIPDLPEAIKTIENTFFVDKPVDFNRLVRYVKMSVKNNG